MKENNLTLKQIEVINSHVLRIAGVVERLNRDFAQPLRVYELPAEARMSTSPLYGYFKEVAGMSLLQFQKQIQLQEARRLLFSGLIDTAEAAFQVTGWYPGGEDTEWIKEGQAEYLAAKNTDDLKKKIQISVFIPLSNIDIFLS